MSYVPYVCYDFGLSSLSNIEKACKALDEAGMQYEKDSMDNYKTMGIFYFVFSSQEEVDKAYAIVEKVIDTSEEAEWE